MSISRNCAHRGYFICIKPRENHQGQFLADFEISKFDPADPKHAKNIRLEHGSVANPFPTEDEAIAFAYADACRAIDQILDE